MHYLIIYEPVVKCLSTSPFLLILLLHLGLSSLSLEIYFKAVMRNSRRKYNVKDTSWIIACAYKKVKIDWLAL